MNKLPFWLNPILISIGWIAIVLLSFASEEAMFKQLIGARKFIGIDDVFVLGTLFLCFGLACKFGSICCQTFFVTQKAKSQYSDLLVALGSPLFVSVITLFFILCVAAYLIWFLPLILSGAWIQIIKGGLYGRSELDALGASIPGVTTMTQFGIPIVIVASFVVFNRLKFQPVVFYYYLFLFIVVVFCAIFRAYFWSERLALFELLVPIGIIFLLVHYCGQLWLRLMPFVAVATVILLFGAFEYSRSWKYFKDDYSNILTFSACRFGGYYISSFNNMAMARDELEVAGEPYNTLGFLYLLPLSFFDDLNRDKSQKWSDYQLRLEQYANPEFNLMSGPGAVVSDFGDYVAIPVFACFGLVSGYLFLSARRGGVLGLLFYPLWSVGLLELGRLLYWSTSRAFPALLGLILFWYLLKYIISKIAPKSVSVAQS